MRRGASATLRLRLRMNRLIGGFEPEIPSHCNLPCIPRDAGAAIQAIFGRQAVDSVF